MRRGIGRSATVLAGILLLSGCTTPGDPAEFRQDRTASDELPAGLVSESVAAETSRFAGTDSAGTRYFLVRATDGTTPCVAVLPADGRSWTACGGAGSKGTGPDGTVVELVDPSIAPDDAAPRGERVGESLRVTRLP